MMSEKVERAMIHEMHSDLKNLKEMHMHHYHDIRGDVKELFTSMGELNSTQARIEKELISKIHTIEIETIKTTTHLSKKIGLVVIFISIGISVITGIIVEVAAKKITEPYVKTSLVGDSGK